MSGESLNGVLTHGQMETIRPILGGILNDSMSGTALKIVKAPLAFKHSYGCSERDLTIPEGRFALQIAAPEGASEEKVQKLRDKVANLFHNKVALGIRANDAGVHHEFFSLACAPEGIIVLSFHGWDNTSFNNVVAGLERSTTDGPQLIRVKKLY